MSYPGPRYTGDTGEVSATFRRSDQPAELKYRTGNTVHYLATGASTGGHFGLYRRDFGVQPSGPSPHFHRTISESFFILSGTVRLYDGKEWVDATAGDYCYVPEGGIHAFRRVLRDLGEVRRESRGDRRGARGDRPSPRQYLDLTLLGCPATRRTRARREQSHARPSIRWLPDLASCTVA
jgi:mannose-6-phosphate isomerase-like protein (cupin superfamily)